MTVAFFVILIGGWFYPLLGYFVPLCMLLGIGIGLFRGRKWCDWFCPRGSFFDTLIKSISPQKKIPASLKSLSVRIGVFVFLMLVLASNLITHWPNPYKIGKFFVIMLNVTTFLGVIFALFFHQRTWCYLCPIGTASSWIGVRRYPLKITSRLCTECGLCNKVCPIQIAASDFKKLDLEIVKDKDCLKCNLCVSVCPKKALTR